MNQLIYIDSFSNGDQITTKEEQGGGEQWCKHLNIEECRLLLELALPHIHHDIFGHPFFLDLSYAFICLSFLSPGMDIMDTSRLPRQQFLRSLHSDMHPDGANVFWMLHASFGSFNLQSVGCWIAPLVGKEDYHQLQIQCLSLSNGLKHTVDSHYQVTIVDCHQSTNCKHVEVHRANLLVIR